jgi:ribosomal protein L17
MPVKKQEDDIVIRIPRRFYDKTVQRLLEHIEFKTIVSKSKATQKQIDKLVGDIKKERRPKTETLLKKAGIKI